MSRSSTLLITSICLGLCTCAPYQYLENGDIRGGNVANKLVSRVFKTQSTGKNLRIRGFYVPDDMFVTNQMSSSASLDVFSINQPAATNPSGCSLIIKNEVCPKQPTKSHASQKSTVVPRSSSRGLLSSLRDNLQKFTSGRPTTTTTVQQTSQSTVERKKHSRGYRKSAHFRLRKSTANVQNPSHGQRKLERKLISAECVEQKSTACGSKKWSSALLMSNDVERRTSDVASDTTCYSSDHEDDVDSGDDHF